MSIYKDSELGIFKHLDDEQRASVMAPMTNLLAMAIAGSGKTRTLTHRVAYLISRGVPQEKIMLLTFTNKAGKEMISRVQSLLNATSSNILSGTFHHVAGRLLRQYASAVGFKPNFTVLTPEDAHDMIGPLRDASIKKLGLTKKEFPTAKIIYNIYSSAFNLNMSISKICSEEEREFEPFIIEEIKLIISEYTKRKKKSNAMDFDDMLLYFNEILDIEYIANNIRGKFEYVLVDEMQDINWVQGDIIRKLNINNNNLFVVGDPNQAIYSWRGGKISYIENFHLDYPNVHKHGILTNYRSDANILKLAEVSIANNYKDQTLAPRFKAHLPASNMPTYSLYRDDNEQAVDIVNMIERNIKDGIELKEISILIRANYLTKIIEGELRRRRVPYRILAGKSFFERKHVLDVLALLQIFDNPQNELAFVRVARLFDGIGDKKARVFYEHFERNDYDIESLAVSSLSSSIKLTPKLKENVIYFHSILKEVAYHKEAPAKVISVFIDSFYANHLRMTEDDVRDRMRDLEFMTLKAGEYESLSLYLADMVIDTDSGTGSDDNEAKVVITTIHKAKGLEWDVVYLPYLNEEVFPSSRMMEPELVDEERRLFYVAVTRAKKKLHMGSVNFQILGMKRGYVSRFIDEVDGYYE